MALSLKNTNWNRQEAGFWESIGQSANLGSVWAWEVVVEAGVSEEVSGPGIRGVVLLWPRAVMWTNALAYFQLPFCSCLVPREETPSDDQQWQGPSSLLLHICVTLFTIPTLSSLFVIQDCVEESNGFCPFLHLRVPDLQVLSEHWLNNWVSE